MTRINTNISSLVAQKNLARSNSQLQEAFTRLSTGLRINNGKDDPAGLIASEVLRADIVSVQAAITNNERSNQVVATADSALSQVSQLLNDIRALITASANSAALSDEQIAANQLQVDSSLEAIDRIAQITSFQGRRLLDGSLDFITTAGANFSQIEDLKLDQANLGTQTSIGVNITVTAAATQAQITYAGGALATDVVFELSGSKGSEVFSFETGATVAQIVAAVNLVSDATGVEATNNAGTLELDSVGYGTDAFVAVDVISGTFATSAERDEGTDIAATVNGVTAIGKGNRLSINTSTLDLSADITAGFAGAIAFSIDGGGAQFQLGPDVVSNQQARVGIQSVNSARLGGVSGRLYELRTGGAKALDTDATGAAEIVEEVISKVTELRGRLGAFQRTTFDTTIATLSDTLENLTAAESSIRDADFAAESARLTRAQILVQSGTSVLAITNQNPQNVLALLR